MIQALVAAVTPLVLIVSGSSPTPIEPGATPPTWLQGQFSNGSNVEMVPYPAGYWPFQGTAHVGPSTAVGVTNLTAMQNAAIAAGTPLTIMGTSQGALVIDQVIVNDIAAGVSPSAVKFVIIEDPNRGSGILTYFRGVTIPFLDYKPIKIPDSPYDTTVVIAEYDGVADAPTNPMNLLADINAFLGQIHHQGSVFTDLSTVPAANITVKTNAAGGVTTTYLVPTAELPIVTVLRNLGLPAPAASFLNKVLRPIIDSAYAGRLKMDALNAAAAKASAVASVISKAPRGAASAVSATAAAGVAITPKPSKTKRAKPTATTQSPRASRDQSAGPEHTATPKQSTSKDGSKGKSKDKRQLKGQAAA